MIASVIVCTYNRATLLERLLEALTHQTAPSWTFEIIIVDDGSEDETPSLCRSQMNRLSNLKYLSMESNSGLSAAANRAVSEAKGRYLLFTDDDCIPHPQWVEKMCDALSISPITAGAIDSSRTNYYKLCHNIAQFYPFMPGRKAGKLDFIAGANMGIHADIFKEIGVFNPRSIIPDMEFILEARRKGFTIAYAPEALVTHDPQRVTFCDVMSYAADHASVTILLRHRYRELLQTPFILFSPILIILTAPLIAFRITSRIYLGNRHLMRLLHTAPLIFLIKMAWCWGAARELFNKNGNKANA